MTWNLIKRIRLYLDLAREVEDWLLSQKDMKTAVDTLEIVFEHWFEDAMSKGTSRSSFEPELRDLVQTHYGYIMTELVFESLGKGLDIYRTRASVRDQSLIIDINVRED